MNESENIALIVAMSAVAPDSQDVEGALIYLMENLIRQMSPLDQCDSGATQIAFDMIDNALSYLKDAYA